MQWICATRTKIPVLYGKGLQSSTVEDSSPLWQRTGRTHGFNQQRIASKCCLSVPARLIGGCDNPFILNIKKYPYRQKQDKKVIIY